MTPNMKDCIYDGYQQSPFYIGDDDFSNKHYQWLAAMGMLDTLLLMGVETARSIPCWYGSEKDKEINLQRIRDAEK